MNPTLYPEFFEHSACPVFVFTDSGKIIYRNLSAKKYLPMLRKNASVIPHLYPAVLPSESGILHIAGNTPYRTMVTFWDGTAFIAFGFIRLQLSDGTYIGDSILRHFSDNPEKWKKLFHAEKELAPTKNHTGNRICTDIFETLNYAKTSAYNKNGSFYETVTVLFQKLDTSFTALGYRIHTAIDPDFVFNRAVQMRTNDFLFIFGVFLYLVMRLSENGHISIHLKTEDQMHVVYFSCKTEKIQAPLEDVSALWDHYLPEYVRELQFLEQSGFLHTDHLRIVCGDYGLLTLEYRVALGEELQNIVESAEFTQYLCAIDVEYFLDTIQRWIKDNDASC